MKTGWVGAIIFIWVIALILGSVNVGYDLFQDSTLTEKVQDTLSFTEVWSEEDWGTLVNPLNWPGFFASVWEMATLDLPLFGPPDSPWQVVRWVVLAPIIGTVIFGLGLLAFSILRRNV